MEIIFKKGVGGQLANEHDDMKIEMYAGRNAGDKQGQLLMQLPVTLPLDSNPETAGMCDQSNCIWGEGQSTSKMAIGYVFLTKAQTQLYISSGDPNFAMALCSTIGGVLQFLSFGGKVHPTEGCAASMDFTALSRAGAEYAATTGLE